MEAAGLFRDFMAQQDQRDDAPPWVRVVIVNYNAGPLLQACVDVLARQSFSDFEAVIVDNASTDGSADALRLPDARFALIRNADNAGFAAANNIGARDCNARWLATLNPDTLPQPGWLEAMHRGTLRHANVRMLGATLLDAADPSRIDGFGDVLSIAGIAWRGGAGRAASTLPDHDIEVFAPCAAAALYERAAFELAGGFDERFFCYLEDVDLGFRLRLAGERCVQLRDAVVLHYGSAITGAASDFTLYHSYRNRLWLLYKNMPPMLLLIALPLNIVSSALLLLLHRARTRAPVGASWRGLLAGMWPGASLAQRPRIQRSRRISTAELARMLDWNLVNIRNRPVVDIAAGRS
jgi:GT2 family glycosyltransferase